MPTRSPDQALSPFALSAEAIRAAAIRRHGESSQEVPGRPFSGSPRRGQPTSTSNRPLLDPNILRRKSIERSIHPLDVQRFREDHPDAPDQSNSTIRRIIAEKEVFPGGVSKEAGPEPSGGITSTAVSLGGGIVQGAITAPARAIAATIGTGAQLIGNEQLAEEFFSASKKIQEQAPDAEGVAGTIGRGLGSAVPTAVALLSSGASAPILAYYALQGFGGGTEDYRETMIARGEDPEIVDQLITGVGYGLTEVVAERIGIDFLGKIGARTLNRIGDTALRGNGRQAVELLSGAARIAGVNASEEVLTQISQNAIASLLCRI